MQTIAEMITAAQERQAKQQTELEAQREESRQKAMARLRSHLNELFGDLPAMLDISVGHREYDSVYATFSYQNKTYHLSEGRPSWYLTRIEERTEDDDRKLPHQDFYAHYHNGVASNQDNFLLALAELSECPDTPRRPAGVAYETPEPTIEERLVKALRAFIQAEAPNTEY